MLSSHLDCACPSSQCAASSSFFSLSDVKMYAVLSLWQHASDSRAFRPRWMTQFHSLFSRALPASALASVHELLPYRLRRAAVPVLTPTMSRKGSAAQPSHAGSAGGRRIGARCGRNARRSSSAGSGGAGAPVRTKDAAVVSIASNTAVDAEADAEFHLAVAVSSFFSKDFPPWEQGLHVDAQGVLPTSFGQQPVGKQTETMMIVMPMGATAIVCPLHQQHN